MEKDLLQAVIKVESEIQQAIESEKKKAADWLESVRASLSQELEAKKKQLDAGYIRSLEETSSQCEFKAQKEIADITRMAEHLQNLPEEILQDIVKRYLPQILPGENR